MKLPPLKEYGKMRDLLFRGKSKSINKGKWIYGSFVEDTDLNACCIRDKSLVYELVDRETVGQYTGLTDKNGKMIFEGDIIRAIALDTGMECLTVVCFGNFIDENNGDGYIGFYIEFDGIKTTAAQLAMKECKNRIEVIGNIHDNPELL